MCTIWYLCDVKYHIISWKRFKIDRNWNAACHKCKKNAQKCEKICIFGNCAYNVEEIDFFAQSKERYTIALLLSSAFAMHSCDLHEHQRPNGIGPSEFSEEQTTIKSYSINYLWKVKQFCTFAANIYGYIHRAFDGNITNLTELNECISFHCAYA